ncbi:MAG: UDP-N-acetylmuramoyl-L-alanine--D-glutamate ligase, partial [Geminicoccaceae bacterium]
SRTGLSACRSVTAGGGRVWAWDDNSDRRQMASKQGIPIVNLDLCNWDRVKSLVLSPGIPLKHPRPHRLVRHAKAAGVPIIGDMELLAENQPGRRIIGVTGTNGKSTTSALIAHVLQNASIGTQLGGNIGLPVLDLLPKPPEDIYVLELSSYQLDLTERLRCTVAVILNISPDHLDRHGGMVGYVRAKRRILRNQDVGDWAVIGIDDAYGQKICKQLKADGDRKVVPISVTGRAKMGVSVVDGQLIDDIDGEGRTVGDLRAIRHLQGSHNQQNAAAAYAAARAVDIPPAQIIEGMESFGGLRHRMELVADIDGIRFINDSKATNPDAAARALACYQPIYWIAGGQAKQDDLDAVLPYLDRIKQAFLIGEAAERFSELLADKVDVVISKSLEPAFSAAVSKARHDDLDGATILLAPACASFDQFANFEDRGDAFRALVDDLVLPGRQAAAASGGGRR